jgi:FAD:protein FMN transferase
VTTPPPDEATSVRLPVRDPEHRRAERVMGTVVSLLLPGGGAGSAAADRCFAWLHEVDRRFSPFRSESEVSRFMRSDPGTFEASPDLAEVLELAEAVRILSDGAFDIRGHRADGAADPTGIVKGWAVDRAGAILVEERLGRFSLNAGGDVLVRGGREPGTPWRIGLAHPHERSAVALVLEAMDLAVATSGTTERGTHIVDARTGTAPAGSVLLLSVVGPSLARADGYATAAFAMGEAGVRWCEGLPGYAACAMTADGRLLTTRSLDRYRAGPPAGTGPS